MHKYYITPKEIYTMMPFFFYDKIYFWSCLEFYMSFFFCFQILQKSPILQNTIIIFFFTLKINLSLILQNDFTNTIITFFHIEINFHITIISSNF